MDSVCCFMQEIIELDKVGCFVAAVSKKEVPSKEC